RRLGQRRVVQDHPVHVEERAEFARHVATRQCGMQTFELALHFPHGRTETLDLGRYLGLGNRVMRDFARRVGYELRTSDRDAARNTDAVQREAQRTPTLAAAAAAFTGVGVLFAPWGGPAALIR